MKRSRKSRGRKSGVKRSRKSRGRKYNFTREFGFFEQKFLNFLVSKVFPLLHRIGAESHIINQLTSLGYKYITKPTYYSISLMYKLIEDILTDGFKLRKDGKLFSLKFYKAGDPDQTPIEDIDFVKGKAIVANGSYEIQQDGTFVGENQTPKSTGTDPENIFVEGSDTENIYINKEGKSNKEVHIRHFMVQEGENLQLYIAHKGTQYYEKINSIISSAKNVLMKFLPEEEIEKILHNPVALSKMTPEDIAEMKESAKNKLQALKDKMNNIKIIYKCWCKFNYRQCTRIDDNNSKG